MSSQSTSAKVAIPYAEALFESSKSLQLIDKTKEDLNIILTTINNNNPLFNFLANPLIVISAKKNVISQLFVDQVSTHVLNFLFILIERRRINLFNSIVTCYTTLVNQLNLITLVKVYTVTPLSDIQMSKLKNKLKTFTNSTVVQLMVEIEPDLIGGFVVKIGSKVIDMSIYGQLNQMS